MLVLRSLLFTTKFHALERDVHFSKSIKHLMSLFFCLYQALGIALIHYTIGFIIQLALCFFNAHWISGNDTEDCKHFKHIDTYGPFCCQVGQTPKSDSYYAANLNSEVLTVKSANPNALLFAFKNWPLPRTNWTNSTSLYTLVESGSPPKGIT